jgi:hypothetical protein
MSTLIEWGAAFVALRLWRSSPHLRLIYSGRVEGQKQLLHEPLIQSTVCII